MSTTPRLKFGLIEIGRGVAASLVVLYHAARIMAQPRFFGQQPFGGGLANFNAGVDFFFVLSGFIIAWIHWDDIGHRDRVGGFARKRFLRIYPPYWGIVIPLILLYLAFPSGGQPSQHDPLNILLSLLLLPNVVQPVLGVAWTLTHEIFFYALFALIILGGRRWLWMLAAWGLAIVAAHAAGPLPFPASFVLSPFNLEFIMGVGAAILLRHGEPPLPVALLIAGTAGFLGCLLFLPHIQDDPLVGRLAFGVPAMLFVLGCVELERRRPIPLPPALAFFGASSYSVYLMHPVVLSLFVRPLARVARLMPMDIAALLLAAMAAAAGMLYHRFVEKRLVDIARRATGGRGGRASGGQAAQPRTGTDAAARPAPPRAS